MSILKRGCLRMVLLACIMACFKQVYETCPETLTETMIGPATYYSAIPCFLLCTNFSNLIKPEMIAKYCDNETINSHCSSEKVDSYPLPILKKISFDENDLVQSLEINLPNEKLWFLQTFTPEEISQHVKTITIYNE